MKIIAILGATEDALLKQKTILKANSLKRKQEALIDSIKSKINESEIHIAELETVTVDTIDIDTWVDRYHEAQVEFKLNKAELAIAEETLVKLFTNDK